MKLLILEIKEKLQNLLGEISTEELLRNEEMVNRAQLVFKEILEMEI